MCGASLEARLFELVCDAVAARLPVCVCDECRSRRRRRRRRGGGGDDGDGADEGDGEEDGDGDDGSQSDDDDATGGGGGDGAGGASGDGAPPPQRRHRVVSWCGTHGASFVAIAPLLGSRSRSQCASKWQRM